MAIGRTFPHWEVRPSRSRCGCQRGEMSTPRAATIPGEAACRSGPASPCRSARTCPSPCRRLDHPGDRSPDDHRPDVVRARSRCVAELAARAARWAAHPNATPDACRLAHLVEYPAVHAAPHAEPAPGARAAPNEHPCSDLPCARGSHSASRSPAARGHRHAAWAAQPCSDAHVASGARSRLDVHRARAPAARSRPPPVRARSRPAWAPVCARLHRAVPRVRAHSHSDAEWEPDVRSCSAA